MQASPKHPFTSDLSTLLPSLFEGKAEYAIVRAVINEAYVIALAHLRAGSSAVQGLLRRLGIRVEDAAYDAIADLFARSDDNRFPTLERWWWALAPALRNNSDALRLAFRRVVTGAVHQCIVRLYRENDPSLGRVIRNIKLALPRHPTLTKKEIHGELSLIPRGCKDLRPDLPPISLEMFLPQFYDAISLHSSLHDMLAAVARILRVQKHYRRAVTLIEVAVIVREAYLSDMRPARSQTADAGLTEEEITAIIADAVEQVRHDSLDHYVRRKTLGAEETSGLLAALNDILLNARDGACGREASYFRVLAKHMPGLNRATYRERYRVVMEYLAKSAKIVLRQRLRQEG